MENIIVTIKDVARLAGVSIGTVDRVVHNRGRVSRETKERVLAVIRETGYSPNLQASRLSKARRWRVAALFPRSEQDNGFWASSLEGVSRANDEFGDLGMISRAVHFDRYSDDDFRSAWKSIMKNKPDALLLAPVLPESARDCLSEWPEDRPLILFDTPLPGVRPLTFVGQDAAACGSLGARLMSMAVDDPEDIVAVQTIPSDYHINQRVEGFLDFFTGKKPDRYRLSHGDLESECDGIFSDILRDHPGIRGIYVTNALVSSMAAESEKHGKKLTIIGYDLTEPNRRFLNEGWIDFLISQRPAGQTYEGIRLLWRSLALGEKVPESVYMPIDILTRENLRFYSQT